MPRLATRLAIAMILVTTASLLVAVVGQVWVARQTAGDLPPAVRARVAELRSDGRVFAWPFRAPPTRQLFETPTPTIADSLWAVDRVQRSQWRGLIYGLALAVVASGGLAWWLARGLARPIEAVGDAASAVASGDLQTRVRASATGFAASAEVVGLTEDFNRMAATLERNELERRAMVADVAHELRTPITAMALRLEALRDGLVPFDAAEVERLSRQTELLHRLVEDLRTLSLADAGRLTLRRDLVDLRDLALTVRDEFTPLADRRGVTLDASDLEPPQAERATTVVGDADRLHQVLGNLVDNALRASPEEGAVRLALQATDDWVTLAVRDDGPGFAGDDLPHVFERFRQGERGRRDVRGRSGLGLAIVRSLVTLHGGEVEARNREAGGADVWVRLPRAGPEQG